MKGPPRPRCGSRCSPLLPSTTAILRWLRMSNRIETIWVIRVGSAATTRTPSSRSRRQSWDLRKRPEPTLSTSSRHSTPPRPGSSQRLGDRPSHVVVEIDVEEQVYVLLGPVDVPPPATSGSRRRWDSRASRFPCRGWVSSPSRASRAMDSVPQGTQPPFPVFLRRAFRSARRMFPLDRAVPPLFAGCRCEPRPRPGRGAMPATGHGVDYQNPRQRRRLARAWAAEARTPRNTALSTKQAPPRKRRR